MRYGIYYAYWTRNWQVDYREYIYKVKRLGFDLLEMSVIPLIDASDNVLLELKNIADSEGLALTSGYGPSAKHNLGSSDPDIVKNTIDFYQEMFRKLELMGIHKIGGGVYSYWPVDYSKPIDKEGDWARSVENVRTVGKLALEHGIDFNLEVLNRFEGYLINTAAEAKKFVEEVDVPSVKIMLDTFHMNIEEDSITEAICTAGKHLGHVHVGERNRKVPGKGNMPWYEVAAALHKINYNLDIVMEPFVLMGGQVGSDIKIWHDISNGASMEKLDQDAANSVAFLRHVFEK